MYAASEAPRGAVNEAEAGLLFYSFVILFRKYYYIYFFPVANTFLYIFIFRR